MNIHDLQQDVIRSIPFLWIRWFDPEGRPRWVDYRYGEIRAKAFTMARCRQHQNPLQRGGESDEFVFLSKQLK